MWATSVTSRSRVASKLRVESFKGTRCTFKMCIRNGGVANGAKSVVHVVEEYGAIAEYILVDPVPDLARESQNVACCVVIAPISTSFTTSMFMMQELTPSGFWKGLGSLETGSIFGSKQVRGQSLSVSFHLIKMMLFRSMFSGHDSEHEERNLRKMYRDMRTVMVHEKR